MGGSDLYAADHHWGDDVIDVDAHDLPALKASYLVNTLPRQGRALEIGCGGGRLLNTISTHRPELSLDGCDIRPLDYEPTEFRFTLVDPAKGELPYEPGSFDAVIMFDVLEHAQDPMSMIKSARAVTRPGGMLVSFTPLEGQSFSFYRLYRRLLGEDLYVETKEHVQSFSEHSLRTLVSSAFTIRDTQFTYHVLGHLMDATLFALLKIPRLRRRFWESNPYYRETRSLSTASDSALGSIMRAANTVAYCESRALRHRRFAAAGMLFTAIADWRGAPVTPMSDSALPPAPPLDDRMQRYMRARAARRWISNALSTLVRFAYPGRLKRDRHSIIIPESSLSPWRYDHAFREVYRQIVDFSLVDEMRLYELWQVTSQLAAVPGDIIEVGVWRGGSGCLAAAASQRAGSSARVYLCDTFSGVVNASAEDPVYSGGEHADTSPQLVQSLADHLGLQNIEILVGAFPDETGPTIQDRAFKLCHLDVDVYESTKAAAEWVWTRLVDGGIVVFDDYGGDGMDGVQRAVEEVAGNPSCRMIHNLNGHAILVKVGSSG